MVKQKGNPFQDGLHFLAQNGLNLFASFSTNTLPQPMHSQLKKNGISLDAYSHLMLTGNGGTLFWARLQEAGLKTADPVDTFSIQLTQQFITHYLDNPPQVQLYPLTDFILPLTQLGELAGWSHPAPIGQGINATFGVWFAYRSAFLVNGRFPTMSQPATPSPCTHCDDKPCITACPPAAVHPTAFNIYTCAHYRITPHSACADRCLARLACPIAPEHRYSLPQIQYHYGQSLETIHLFSQKNKHS